MENTGCRISKGGCGIRSRILALAFCILFPAFCIVNAAVPVLDTYYSPKNSERPVRSSTRFIILHTTEGPARGSGTKLQKNGEAHYMVDEVGRIYRIIDRKRVAYHCGRSMWNGLSSLDNCSVGIEIVGYHNKDLTAAQYKALKPLIAELQKTYRVPDDRVLTHSMVAYGAPNQWHKRSHRGRKRCAMRMALPSVRRKLGLTSKPSFDPDVKAGRLVVADRELHQLLYSVEKKSKKTAPKNPPAKEAPVLKAPAKKTTEQAKKEQKTAQASKASGDAKAPGALTIGVGQTAWDVVHGAYNAHDTLYVFPNGEQKRGDEIGNWKSVPSGTRVTVGVKDAVVRAPTETVTVASAARQAKAAHGAAQQTAAKTPAPAATAATAVPPPPPPPAETSPESGEALDEAAALSAYAAREAGGNVVGKGKSAWDIARDAYAAETTIYEFPSGERKKGSEITNWKAIPPGTRITVAEGDINEPEKIVSLADAAASSDATGNTGSAAANPGVVRGTANANDRAASPILAALSTIAGAEWNSDRTIYVTEKGKYFKGSELNATTIGMLTPETKVFSGYKIGGPVTARNPAFAICGPVWRNEDTVFLLPDGRMEPGDKVDPQKIPARTMILYKD